MKHTKRYARFCSLLRCLREEAGLFQSELAARLGKPQTFVSKVELGERHIDFLETLDFCRACGVTLKQFAERLVRLERDDPPPGDKPQRRRKRRRQVRHS